MQTETDALRAENQRLRVIISALADKLVVIETELTSFAQKMNIVKAFDYSNDKKTLALTAVMTLMIKMWMA